MPTLLGDPNRPSPGYMLTGWLMGFSAPDLSSSGRALGAHEQRATPLH